MTTKASLLLTAAAVLLALPASAVPVLTKFTDGSSIVAVSGDGSTVLGKDSAGSFFWTRAAGKTTVPLPNPAAISKNGSVVTGYASNNGQIKAYRWTQAAGFQYIPGLAGTALPGITLPPYANGLGISGDGNTILGVYSTAQVGSMAFKWNGGTSTSLGDLTGGSQSSTARAISDDGNLIVGDSDSTNGQEAFAKFGTAALKGLGNVTSLPPLDHDTGYASSALAVSPEGDTIVGYGNLYVSLSGENGGFPRATAVRWTVTGTTVGTITKLAALTMSATGLTPAVTQANACSSNGTVIVGAASIRKTVINSNGTPTFTYSDAAAVWSGTAIHKPLADLLRSAGVASVDDATFRSAVGISADADTIVGNGDSGAWIVTGARSLFGLSSLDAVLPKVSVAVAGGNPVVTYDIVPGQSYQIQRSTTLGADWVNLGDVFSTVGQTGAGTKSVTDTTAPVGEKAFYRVTVQVGS